ncbi:hypothetical protein LSH36_326g05037 [Paralvinella palmiformis]|uniref:Fanconi anemia core complex-associated protein 24 pseudonuclease domain-containing protein n=1 Tax=Paralvinella palmiformis TaxID=53620 RepID=A0AAD9N0S2_9ANNE|nr:hypothetical protein LSH36_326g05037 [Paralvinella palmiformis]
MIDVLRPLLCTRWAKCEPPPKVLVNILYEDRLGVVDFHPSSDMAVVYLSEGDLVAGSSYKRKLAKLRMASSMRGIVLAERTPTSCQYFAGLQTFAVLELGLVLIPVSIQNEAADLLIQLVSLENRPQTNQFRMKRKSQPPDGAIFATLQLIPRLGEIKARALLDKFHSIDQICNATLEKCRRIFKADSPVTGPEEQYGKIEPKHHTPSVNRHVPASSPDLVQEQSKFRSIPTQSPLTDTVPSARAHNDFRVMVQLSPHPEKNLKRSLDSLEISG